jgi:hypothetical protein
MVTDCCPVSTLEVAKTCHKIPALLSYRVRCSKANCRCASGEAHGPYWFLRWREQSGRHRRRYVRAADVESVRAIISLRRAEREEARIEAAEARIWLRQLRALVRDLECT